jgi:glycolate oxidase iron-sulfur subunit
MQTTLAPEFAGTDAEGREAEAILRKCVHCGFCTATCPTYQLLGDELDGPRGRIYLIKQVLEGETPTRDTQLHLDRCLTCRNCETTCPSGVQYGHLVDIGRQIVDAKVPRPPAEARTRRLLRGGLTSPLFGPAMRLGQSVRGFLPAALKAKVPERRAAGAWPRRAHARKVLLLEGCVQPAMAPGINAATARVLDAAGIECVLARGQGCCGAVKFHLADSAGGLAQMRANIDAWWPPAAPRAALRRSGRKSVGAGARFERAAARSGGRAAKPRAAAGRHAGLARALHAAAWAKAARRGGALPGRARFQAAAGGARGAPVLRLGGHVLGVATRDLSHQLRDRKLGHLGELEPDVIVSANIGCITHLQSGTPTPVRHWVEVLDEHLR